MTFEDFYKSQPDAVSGLRALSRSADSTGLDKTLVELLKIRASQINGCAFCLQFHLNLARQLDCPPDKLDQLAAWHDSSLFGERERAALAWTEALTRDAAHGATAQAREHLATQFSGAEIEGLTIAIAAINAWNRLAGALHFAPPARK